MPASSRRARRDEAFKHVLDELNHLEVHCALLSDMERAMLWKSVLGMSDNEAAIVEIGSYCGASTILLAKAAGGHRSVYAIDPHTGIENETDEGQSFYVADTWRILNKNIQQAGLADRIRPLRLRSEEAVAKWAGPIGLLFIDGSHRYEDVKKDILLWQRHLLPGSKVVLHDLWTIGVRRVVAEHILSNRAFGDFVYSPPSMFSATFLGSESHSPQYAQRSLWLAALRLKGVIDLSPTLRRWLHTIVKRMS